VLGRPAEQGLCLGARRVEVDRAERERLLDFDFRNVLRIIVDHVRFDTRGGGAELRHPVQRHRLGRDAVENFTRRSVVADRRRNHGRQIFGVRHGRELVTRSRDQDRAATHDAIEEPFFTVLVGTVARQVLRSERAHLQWKRLQVSFDDGVTTGFLHRITFDVRRRDSGLVDARTGHKQKLRRSGADGEIRNRTDSFHILTVVIHDDIELRITMHGLQRIRVAPHRLHTQRTNLIKERERGLLHLLVAFFTDDIHGHVVSRRSEGLREPETNVRVTTTVGVDDQDLLLIGSFNDDRARR